MEIDHPIPRTNAELLGKYVGRKVRVAGKIDALENGHLTLVACDGGRVVVDVNPTRPYTTPYAEVTGIVKGPGHVEETDHDNWGEKFGRLVRKSGAREPPGRFAGITASVAEFFIVVIQLVATDATDIKVPYVTNASVWRVARCCV